MSGPAFFAIFAAASKESAEKAERLLRVAADALPLELTLEEPSEGRPAWAVKITGPEAAVLGTVQAFSDLWSSFDGNEVVIHDDLDLLRAPPKGEA